jgi:hypothetical protein
MDRNMHQFLNSFYFIFATGLLFFAPGWLILRIFFGNKRLLIPFETLIFSFGISFGLVDLLMILLGKLGITFNTATLSLGIIGSLVIFALVAFLYKKFPTFSVIPAEAGIQDTGFTKHQNWLFIILIALTILIKTVYLAHAVLPTATDLGHHMYWAKLISTTGKLPFYAKQEIITGTNDTYQITDPQPIADFIIGEHLPFAAVNIFSGLDFFSAFPVIFLFLVNMLGLFTLIVLSLYIANDLQNYFSSNEFLKNFTPQNAALAVLFFFGPLYTLASPQAKFVSGGVVGNTLGNFFIPLIILAYFRAFKEKSSGFLALGFFLTFVLAYTHHLSTLVLLFVLVASLVVFIFFNFNNLKEIMSEWRKIFFAPAPILVVLFVFVFLFVVALPTYFDTHAINTAIGTPTKTTRTGLTFSQITFSAGEARVGLGLVGLVLLTILVFTFRQKRDYANAFILGWGIILFVMTFAPAWLFIDIPSNRIGAYLSFPLGMLAAIATVTFFANIFSPSFAGDKLKNALHIPNILLLFVSFSFFVFASGSGSFDNSQTLLAKSKAIDALQTFAASRYLADHSSSQDVILKDHNYIAADSWMKLFFLRDYSYPLSRGFFKRYEDNHNREQCTLLMISTPNTPQGEKCYNDLGVNFVVVNPRFDTAQFKKSEKFSRVYASDIVDVYKRK